MVNLRNHNLILNAVFTQFLNQRVKYELGKICPQSQFEFQKIYLERHKSQTIAVICVIFFPCTHYAFLGKWQMQVLFWLTLGGAGIWWIFDIFRIKKLVKKRNTEIQNKILLELKSVNVFDKNEYIRPVRAKAVRVRMA
ncbi:MAG: TM2 domain-containing protein [Bacteroidetes bacterium]|nr:TM2 domain-containing protein [Bacteroidota bacterium]